MLRLAPGDWGWWVRDRLVSGRWCRWVAAGLSGVSATALLLGSNDGVAQARPRAVQGGSEIARSIPIPVRATVSDDFVVPIAAAGVDSPPELAETQPVDAAGEAARRVLERHCARCHQSERLAGRHTAAGGIANILALEEIAANPALVRRGEPDASAIYQQMIARQMPADVLRHDGTGEAPTASEIRAVRAWIKGLARESSCKERGRVTADDLGDVMRAWLRQAGEDKAAETRFVSLAHLANDCAGDALLLAQRQGVVKLFNSLSWSARPVIIETVGDAHVLMAVRLGDLGWTPEHWNVIVGGLPAAGRLPVPADVATSSRTEVPVVAADWLADRVTRSDIYARLLGLPASLDDLARILGIDLDDRREDRVVRRAALTASGATGQPRVIERYPTPKRVMWIAHDYDGGEAKDAILDHPLLPWAAASEETAGQLPPPVSRGARAMFALPNGLDAFMLFDEEGRARSEASGETGIAPAGEASLRNRQAVHGKNGFQCLACHGGGALGFEDQLAPHLASDDYRGNAVARDIARQIVADTTNLERFISEDRQDVLRALNAAGVEAGLRLEGQDLILGLADFYRRDVDLDRAASEMLIAADDLKVRLGTLRSDDGGVNPLALRLMTGRLARADFERLRAAFAGSGGDGAGGRGLAGANGSRVAALGAATGSVGAAEKPQASEATAQSLKLWPNKVAYNAGDAVVLTLESGRTCHLTVVNVDSAGKATVLFPNEFDRDNLVKAGVGKRVPSAEAPYQFLLKQTGAETFVAICEEGEPVPAGVKHDLTHQNFTGLGNWDQFLDTSIEKAGEPRVPLDNGDDIDRRRRVETKPRPPPARQPAQQRAAFTVTIAP